MKTKIGLISGTICCWHVLLRFPWSSRREISPTHIGIGAHLGVGIAAALQYKAANYLCAS